MMLTLRRIPDSVCGFGLAAGAGGSQSYYRESLLKGGPEYVSHSFLADTDVSQLT